MGVDPAHGRRLRLALAEFAGIFSTGQIELTRLEDPLYLPAEEPAVAGEVAAGEAGAARGAPDPVPAPGPAVAQHGHLGGDVGHDEADVRAAGQLHRPRLLPADPALGEDDAVEHPGAVRVLVGLADDVVRRRLEAGLHPDG